MVLMALRKRLKSGGIAIPESRFKTYFVGTFEVHGPAMWCCQHRSTGDHLLK